MAAMKPWMETENAKPPRVVKMAVAADVFRHLTANGVAVPAACVMYLVKNREGTYDLQIQLTEPQ